MPGRKKTDGFWVDEVRRIREANPGLGPGPIAKKLVDDYPDRNDQPAERTVARLLFDYEDLPEPTRRLYREVRWPESFSNGPLPWSSSAAVLEMIGYAAAYDLPRPHIIAAQWYWRLSQAVPDAPVEERYSMAWRLTLWEAESETLRIDPRAIEAYLLYRPWVSREQRAFYEEEAAIGMVPEYPYYAASRWFEDEARVLLAKKLKPDSSAWDARKGTRIRRLVRSRDRDDEARAEAMVRESMKILGHSDDEVAAAVERHRAESNRWNEYLADPDMTFEQFKAGGSGESES